MSLLVTFTNAKADQLSKVWGADVSPDIEINADKVISISEFNNKARITVATGGGIKDYRVAEDKATVKLRIEDAEIERATKIAHAIGTPPAR